MNVDRILQLADHIEQQPDVHPGARKGFSMLDVRHPCGTASCIWGHAGLLFVDGFELLLTATPDLHELLELDGWSFDESENSNPDSLLSPEIKDVAMYTAQKGEPGYITASHAAAVLRHLAETGEVDWTVQPGPTQEDLQAQEAIEELITALEVVELAQEVTV